MMTNYMDMVMRETKREALRQQSLDRFYRKLHLSNLINRAEFMEGKGQHLEEKVTQNSVAISIAEIASNMSVTTQSRHRMAKEIAEELIVEHGATAHFYCVEKLANDTTAPKLWRDVLTYIDEMEANDGGGNIGSGVDEPRGEQEGNTDTHRS